MSKPKLWEDPYLSSAVSLTLQIVENLESASKSSGVPVYDLPDSIINSELLYHIATCYNTLYETLLDQDVKLYGNKLNAINQQLN
jgi:hypothetical protein